MSRRPTNNSAGVALFPFLAVLVCTMGSLILLLIVTTKRIRAAAIEKARQAVVVDVVEREPIVSEVEPESVPVDVAQHERAIQEWQTQLESLTHERDSAQESLTDLERKLAAAESAMLRTQQTASTKKDKLKEARSVQQKAATDRERLQKEVDAMRDELAASEQRLTDAKERQKTAQSKFAFIPFDGRNGTTRRPILIECTENFIRFVPEDVRMTESDLAGFTPGINPLRSGVTELIRYWEVFDRLHAEEAADSQPKPATENELLSDSSQGTEPYVLLIVRPHGERMFLAAKIFLSQLKVPYGYELLDENMELEFANPDENAQRNCREAVTHLLAEKAALIQKYASPRGSVNGSGPFATGSQSHVSRGASGGSLMPTSAKRSPDDVATAGGRGESPSDLPQRSLDHADRLAGTNLRPATGSDFGEGLTEKREGKTPAEPRTMGKNGSAGASPSRSSATSTEPTQRAPLGNDEPPEERLPTRNTPRFENDDSKPFPLGRSNRSAGASATSTASPGQPRETSSKTSESSAANRNRTQAAADGGPNGQRSTSSGDLRNHKRRYAMRRSGIGIEKGIRIRVWSNRILVGEEFEIPVDANVRTESLVERVLMTLDREQASWPSAGVGYHWVPTLKYEVAPGGDQVHERLNSALFDLGLVSSVTYLDVDPDEAAKAKRPLPPKKGNNRSTDESAAPSRETSRARATGTANGGTP